MIGISYEFYYPESTGDGTFGIVTARSTGNDDRYTLFVTDVKENTGKSLAEQWSPAFVGFLLDRVDLLHQHKPSDVDVTPVDVGNVTLIECVESRDGESRKYYIVSVYATGKVDRKPTTIEQIEELTDDYFGDDFEDATHYR